MGHGVKGVADVLELGGDRSFNTPIQVAVAPRRINIRENPATKKSELIRTIRFSLSRNDGIDFLFLSSVKVTPDTKEIYPGTRGNTQGDKKEISPAVKAINMETSGIFYLLPQYFIKRFSCHYCSVSFIQNARRAALEVKLNGHIPGIWDNDGFFLSF